MARRKNKRVNNEEDEWMQAIIDESVYSSIFEIADKDERIQLMRDKSIIDDLVGHTVDPDKVMFVHGYKVRSDKDYWK
ncbi:MAG: hypothetical protein QXO37_09620 [Candidatus Nitrosocaldaceae archaeon]